MVRSQDGEPISIYAVVMSETAAVSHLESAMQIAGILDASHKAHADFESENPFSVPAEDIEELAHAVDIVTAHADSLRRL